MKNISLFTRSTFLPRARYLCLFILAFVLGIGQMWGADPVVISLPTPVSADGVDTYTYSATSEIKVKNVGGVWFEIPASVSSGTFQVKGSGDKDDRYLYIYKTNGTVKDDTRKIVFKKEYDSFNFTSADIKTDGGKYYLVFGTSDDYKMSGECAKLTVASAPATTYTVTYKANGGTGSDVVDDEATQVADNTFTAPSGKSFNGWNTAANGSGTAYAVGDDVTSDLTLYAQWADIYTVTYNANGGTGSMSSTENEIAECTFTAPTGKVFKEWNTAANGSGTAYATGDAVTSNLTLYAIWQAAPTVIFQWEKSGSTGFSTDETNLNAEGQGSMTIGTSVLGRKLGENNVDNNSAGYKLGNNDVCIEIQGTSAFEEGDTVIITGKNGGSGDRCFVVAPSTTTNAATDTIKTSTISSQTDNSVYIAVLKSAQAGAKIRIFRLAGSTMYCKSIKVIRPAQKEVKSTVNTLTSVKLNGTEISAANLSTLTSTHSVALTDALAEAPTITFNKHTRITYEDDTYKETDTPIEVKASVVAGNWSASTTIDAVTYTVTAVKLVARTVSYYDGTTKLGEEVVADGTKATAAEIETGRTLYTFDGWYNDAELTSAFNIASTNITADKTLYGKWTKLYATTTDFETEASAETAMATFAAAHNLSMTNLGSSEWDNGSKSGFVGYKLKNSGARLSFFVQAGKRVTFKFGSAANPTLTIGGVEQSISLTTGDNAETTVFYNVVSEAEVVLTTTSNSTVTLKSITIGDIPAISDDATLSDLKVGGTTVTGFSAGTTSYYVEMPYGTAKADLPLVTVTANEEHATVTVQDAKDRPSDTRATISVVAQDGVTTKLYYVYFYNAPKLGVELIKATHTGAKTATIEGFIGGSVDKNTQGDGKLGSNEHYFGLKLAEGNFQAGDVLYIKASALNGGNTATIYSDKGTTSIATDGTFDEASKSYTYTLAAEAEWIYLYRKSSSCNPHVNYMAVYREMASVITEFSINDVAGVIDQEAKTIAIELPAGTDVTSLTPTVTFYANGGGSITPATAQNFTSPVNYTVSSAYAEDASVTYAVTVTVAAPSENANLESLTVAGYALAFDKDVTTYDLVLDYGTAALPEIAYTVEDDAATAVKVENGVNGATTITVTPAAGSAYNKVYTINFSVSTSPKFVIYDGSKMSDIASSRTGSDVSTGFSWSMASNIPTSGSDATASWNGKAYTKVVKGFKPSDNSNNIISFVIPDGYMAKVCLVGSTNSDTKERKMFLSLRASKNADDAFEGYVITSSSYDAVGLITDYILPGTYYLGSTDSYRLYEFSVTLYPAYTRSGLSFGNIGTFCPDKSVVAYRGVSFYELGGGLGTQAGSGSDAHPFMLVFNEVDELIAGMPYLFVAEDETMGVVYDGDAVLSAGHYNGFYGTLSQIAAAADNILVGKYAVVGTEIRKLGGWCQLPANRAYFDLSDSDFRTYTTKEECYAAHGAAGTPNPAPNRRRVTLSNNEANQATAIEYLYDDGRYAPAAAEGCFDVLGRKIVEPLQNGVYILNGKKVVIVK